MSVFDKVLQEKLNLLQSFSLKKKAKKISWGKKRNEQ